MSEPTIDEMIEWLQRAGNDYPGYERDHFVGTIVGILQQHRGQIMVMAAQSHQHDLHAVRAFVERVEMRAEEEQNRMNNQESYAEYFLASLRTEIAALEREAE